MPNWSKEEKKNYDKSEVFQELEKLTIANIHRLDILMKKTAITNGMSTEAIKATDTALKGLADTMSQVKRVSEEAGLAAEDQLSDESEDVSLMSGLSKEMAKKITNESLDSQISDTVINELMEMKEAAIKEGNIKLAYKIERTLDEILSVETI